MGPSGSGRHPLGVSGRPHKGGHRPGGQRVAVGRIHARRTDPQGVRGREVRTHHGQLPLPHQASGESGRIQGRHLQGEGHLRLQEAVPGQVGGQGHGQGRTGLPGTRPAHGQRRLHIPHRLARAVHHPAGGRYQELLHRRSEAVHAELRVRTHHAAAVQAVLSRCVREPGEGLPDHQD